MKIINHKNKVFTAILIGFLLYGIKAFLETISHPLQSISAILGLLLIFGSPFFYNFKKINPLRGHIRIVYYSFLIWTLFIIIRPLINGQSYTQDSIHPYSIFGLTSYLLPLIVLLGTRTLSLSKIFTINLIFSIIGYVYFAFNFNNIQQTLISGIFNYEDGIKGINDLANEYYYWFNISIISMLCYGFISKWKKLIAVLANVFALFLMIYLARRGIVFMLLLYFLGTFYLYIFQYKRGNRLQKLIFTIFTISIIGLTIWMYSNSTFSLLFERLNEDSRSGVNESIIKYFNQEHAWLFGKGIEGAYPEIGYDKPRYGHETGLYHLILKGGIVYLILYSYILLQSAYKGMFKTRNNLTKGLSIYVFLHVVYLIPFGVPSFGLEYLFVWVAIAFLQSKEWRLMTNEQIINTLYQKK